MKLERYKDKKETRKKVILIGLTVITLMSVSMALFKTFANFRQTVSFTIMSGKVKYKKKSLELGTDIPPSTDSSGNGLYEVSHTSPSGWTQTEYRYAGSNPNNYVYFNCKDGEDEQNKSNCELWRIIGKVNVKSRNGLIGQRLKIIRNESIGDYSWDYQDGENESDWTKASLMKMLNDGYYNSSSSVQCYKKSNGSKGSLQACNFSQNQAIRGLSSKARDMIDKETSWNIGIADVSAGYTAKVYECERSNETSLGWPSEWNSWTTKDPSTELSNESLFRGVGLMYPSDYAFGVGGSVRDKCIKSTYLFQFYGNCSDNDWLTLDVDEWTIGPGDNAGGYYDEAVVKYKSGFLNDQQCSGANGVRPAVFLNQKWKLSNGSGTMSDPYHLVTT